MVSAVDTRTIGKPKSFDGKKQSWREFRLIFEAFGGTAHMALTDMMLNAESMGGAPVVLSDLDLENKSMAKQLYYMLVMVTTDDAHKIISNLEQGRGAESWRRLCWE